MVFSLEARPEVLQVTVVVAVGMVVCRLLKSDRFVECKGVWADIGCVRRRQAGLGQADMVVEVVVVVRWRIAPSMNWSGRHKVGQHSLRLLPLPSRLPHVGLKSFIVLHGYGRRRTLDMWFGYGCGFKIAGHLGDTYHFRGSG
ncbi:hypothetical protein Dimus_003369 [Dionaea muscipula]